MRYLRIVAICVFVISVGFFAWTNVQYYSGINTDIPTITSDTELLTVSTAEGKEALLKGLKAQDETDGDLTDQIMIASISHFAEANTVNVKYAVFDSANNFASLTRKVCFTDYVSPRFSLDVPAMLTRGDNFDILDRIKVVDCIDGDISGKVRVITNMVNIYAAGVYPVTLEVTNSCGDLAQMTLWVTILDKENSAAIELSEYIVYVDSGSSFDPNNYVSKVTNSQGSFLPKDAVQVRGSLDLNTPGVYRLEYYYEDQQAQGQTTLMVVVQDRGGAS